MALSLCHCDCVHVQLGRSGSSRQPGSPRSLLGRKVKTKWLEDGVANYYEAVVTDYNEAEVGCAKGRLLYCRSC